jgi:Histidine kinase-, DNA gyrase B-, and HSP90-like ATPase
VGNASKFTDIGEVRVRAKAVNGHFYSSVIDTRPDIPAEHQTRIFEQFCQVDSSGGTGRGLAIAKQIVELHGVGEPSDGTAGAPGSNRRSAGAQPSKWSSPLALKSGNLPHDRVHLLDFVSAIS